MSVDTPVGRNGTARAGTGLPYGRRITLLATTGKWLIEAGEITEVEHVR